MNYSELFPLFKTIIKEFNLKGKLREIRCISTGNINDTYLCVNDFHNGEKQYLFQRVNHNVFANPEDIADNVQNVTAHIEEKLKDEKVTDIRRRVLRYYRKKDGSRYHVTPDGNYWRVVSYVYGAVSVNDADETYLRYAGSAFGKFQRYLSDFEAETLHDTIPDFHNTVKRYGALRESADKDVVSRLASVRDEYDYLMSMEKEATILCTLADEGKLPLRVVHNDTKCNNVMFDVDTDEDLAVIDLDTVMPGLMGNDFGDAVRFAANPGGEDNPDTSKIHLDLDYYTAFVEGFVPQIMSIATEDEINSLPDSVLAITLELASRFLKDYLDGDVYFKCKMDRHNLVRTRAQIALAKDIAKKMPELRARLETVVKSIG